MSQKHRIKFAAVQMCAELAEVDNNLAKAEQLIREAASRQAEWVLLPEFFPSACAFHPKMLDAILPVDGKATQLLNKLSKELNIKIGGSFLARHAHDVFNTFVLVLPNDKIYMHNKDIPTMWENCYYIGGNDDGVLKTKSGNVGVALCWEMLRSQTAHRMFEKVNFILSGSCWWNLPESAPAKLDKLRQRSLELLQETPITFAKLLGVPVIHAGHAGDFEGYAAPSEERSYKSHYLGETQIVNAMGEVVTKMSRSDEEGVIVAEIDIAEKCKPSMKIPKDYWIPNMPKAFLSEWEKLNNHGKDYYKMKTV